MTYARRQPSHAPQKMTRAYNETQALAKIATAPLDKLTLDMVASIARTHKVGADRLLAALAERQERESAHG